MHKFNLEKESWAAVLFILASIPITLYRPYLLLLTLFVIVVYLISRDFIISSWLSFVFAFLFYRAKYFTEELHFPNGFLDLGATPVLVTYFVAFSDALLVLLFYALIRKKRRDGARFSLLFRGTFVEAVILLIVVLGIASSWFSSMPYVAFFELLLLVKLFAIYSISKGLLLDKRIVKLTFELLFLFVFFNAVLVILQKIHGGPLGLPIESINQFVQYGIFADESKGLYRPGGITTSPNLFGSIFGMMMPLLFVLGVTRNNFNKGFIWMILITVSIALVFTSARAVWIFEGLVLPLAYRKLRMSKLLAVPSWVGRFWKPLLLMLGIILIPSIVHRLATLQEIFSESGGGIYRIRHLVMAWDLMKNNPLGSGLNVFQYEIVQRYSPEYFFYDSTPAHNVFAQVGAGFGVFGVVLFLLLYYRLLKDRLTALGNKKLFDPLFHGITLSMVVYLLVLQVHPWLNTRPIAEIFWLLAGYSYEKST